jgi:deoxyribodipyrimidine photo-lyase
MSWYCLRVICDIFNVVLVGALVDLRHNLNEHTWMDKPYKLALHIFRRDLRLDDNTALIEALNQSLAVMPCFIFDTRQIENNPYKSDHCLQFMAHSLRELDAELRQKQAKLHFFYGIAEDIVDALLTQVSIEAVFINRDYTPFSRARDHQIEACCQRHGVYFHCYADALLHEPEQVLKTDHQPYTIFTHAFNKARQLKVASPRKNSFSHYYQTDLAMENHQQLPRLLQINSPDLRVKGGRKEALTLLKCVKNLGDYQKIRNFPAASGTTLLSAHNKFGTLSIREFYSAIEKAFGPMHTFITELYWRDFFTHVAFYFPHVFVGAFHKKYDKLKWSQNEDHFRAWCEGRTGFPLVDAGMRELNTTGYMHNRVRMVVASFLTKDLHVDWHWGEKYFAQQLVDYDPAVNNGNWQWAASTGCDAQPYFRLFNPWLQQKKYDSDCLYIKRFIPELAEVSPRMIHRLFDNEHGVTTTYPLPIINHAKESQQAKIMYKEA